MILNVTQNPQRCVRSFDKRVWLLISVLTNGLTLHLCHEQSEASPNSAVAAFQDGAIVTQAGTANTPYGTWWKGDLWFYGSGAGTAALINTGEFEDDYPSVPTVQTNQ